MLLSKKFLSKYEPNPITGFGDMSQLILQMKYSRTLPTGEKESWVQIIQRVVESLFWINDEYIKADLTVERAESMFDDMYNLKYLPAGRPLANLGSKLLKERRLGAILNNCAGVSFEEEGIVEGAKLIIALSLLGVGVGVNVELEHDVLIYEPIDTKLYHVVEDTREGWVNAVGLLIESFLSKNKPTIKFDYCMIRKKGSLIHGTGGIHSGYKPFKEMLEGIRTAFKGKKIVDSTVLADISNHIGKCVIAGGQRRTALLLMGNAYDEDFKNLKNYDINPYRASMGWSSNNSYSAILGMNYTDSGKRIADGEDLGLIWMENVHRYGRMNGEYNSADKNTVILNPCGEMPQESGELCNLIEFNPNKGDKNAEQVLYNAVLTAKILSSMPTGFEKTDKIIKKNHRFGISQTGITEYLDKYGVELYVQRLESWYNTVQLYDREISEFLGIPTSIRTTTVKPSGTISKIMGTTAGIHYATGKYLLRRVQVSKGSGYGKKYKRLGYHVEDSVYDSESEVISFPITHNVEHTIKDVTMRQQLENAKMMQEHWSDNAVSVTITFKEREKYLISNYLRYYQYYLKGISFLPESVSKYKQLPEQVISPIRFKFENLLVKIKRYIYSFKKEKKFVLMDAKPDNFCTNDTC